MQRRRNPMAKGRSKNGSKMKKRMGGGRMMSKTRTRKGGGRMMTKTSTPGGAVRRRSGGRAR